MTIQSDGDLVAAVRRGDDRAFEELYARYSRRISSYIFGMVKDHARAEDLTQDVFMSALRRMRDTDRPIAFKPWIYEIAKNACIDQFRRSRRAEEVSYDAEEGLGAADYGRLVTGDPTPDVALDQKQQLDHLRGALGGLSDSHHQILVMREFEGLSYREIGQKMGMSRPSVESTLFRARKRLTEEYEELVTGTRCTRIQSIITSAGTGLGARDRRRMARHLSYCQPCRRHAHAAGLAEMVPERRPLGTKIAALLPLPAFLRRRLVGQANDAGAGVSAGHGGTLAQWTANLGPAMDSTASGWTKAIATAATVAVAGVGAGAMTTTSAPHHTSPVSLVSATVGHHGSSTRSHGALTASPAAGATLAVPQVSAAGQPTLLRRAPDADGDKANGGAGAAGPSAPQAPGASGGSAPAASPQAPDAGSTDPISAVADQLLTGSSASGSSSSGSSGGSSGSASDPSSGGQTHSAPQLPSVPGVNAPTNTQTPDLGAASSGGPAAADSAASAGADVLDAANQAVQDITSGH